jgi:hypothetical protein
MIVSFFDRQNMYRASFPDDFCRRDGIVVEWVVTNERCVDFDRCVELCDAFVYDLIAEMKADLRSRPLFSVMYRLSDYFFASDNVEGMLRIMEDSAAQGISIPESTTAKFMQLACAFNDPRVPEYFLRWRCQLPQCAIATPDISRLLFYYCRSGGGRPCAHCGEPFNHRNAGRHAWESTPEHQRQCPMLLLARKQKGVYEDVRTLPQAQDHSSIAFQLWEFSRQRSIPWTHTEWRGMLLCCTFSPRALEAKQLLDEHFDHDNMDDFLRGAYVRLLRHNDPSQIRATVSAFVQVRGLERVSPIVLQEALMGISCIENAEQRIAGYRQVHQWILERDTYVVPYAKRWVKEQSARRGELSKEEAAIVEVVLTLSPRKVNLLDLKDSVWDFMVGTSKKNEFVASATERIARDTRIKLRSNARSANKANATPN